MRKHLHLYTSLSILMLTLIGSGFWFMNPFTSLEGETRPKSLASTTNQGVVHGKHVLIHLDTNIVELKDGTSTLITIPILSQGKPGSYYETIGGNYLNDYKTPLHFSSIGHVYMPYSVHIFGNYFIHGVPYYPDGTSVSSTYSGGCVRLATPDAEKVYTFVEDRTPIILTRSNPEEFNPTATSTDYFVSEEMTTLMVATISLETLTQDTHIIDLSGSITTRRDLLTKLIHEGDQGTIKLYTSDQGEQTFLDTMNAKAQSLGLTNTTFTSTTGAVRTTYDDYVRFMTYISTYKSYLRTLPTSLSL